MSKNKRLANAGWWIGLVLFAGMICLMLGDILQRDGVIGSKTDVLVMGTNAGFKPFEYIDNNEIVGFDVDLAREIAKSMGKELKIEDMSFDGLLSALDSGQIDMVAAGMTVTPERAKNALFSDPYYSASQRIIVKKGSPIRNTNCRDGKSAYSWVRLAIRWHQKLLARWLRNSRLRRASYRN